VFLCYSGKKSLRNICFLIKKHLSLQKPLRMPEKFQIKFLEESAAFLDKLDEKARDKVIYNIHKARITNDKELFKKLKGEIWEFRTFFNKKYYRLFAFWDKTGKTDTIVISTHGLIKKTDKILQSEMIKAETLRKLYFEQKTLEK
jgi:phage-related protein